jgi:hypothetical protein
VNYNKVIAVNIYNAESSLARFKNKIINALANYTAGVVDVNSKVVGLAPTIVSLQRQRCKYLQRHE